MGFGLKLLYEASQMAGSHAEEKDAAETVAKAERDRVKETPLAIAGEAFGLTFVAEWGDLTHTICAAIATNYGCWLCDRRSERTLTAIGGGLFLLFGGLAAMSRLG